MTDRQIGQIQLQANVGHTGVLIVGSGPCGLVLAKLLQQQLPAAQITLLERSNDEISNGSPLSASCATRLVSQNVSETATNMWFRTMESLGCIVEEADTNLSSTRERPRGWSRLSGQWKHYRSPIRGNLFAAMRAQAGGVTVLNGKAVDSLTVGSGSTGLVMQVNTQLGQERIPCPNIIVLAVPVHETLRITEALPLPRDVRLVLQRRGDECEKRYCRTIRVDRATLLGRCLFEKFQAGKLRELDVSGTDAVGVLVLGQAGVFLLALADDLDGSDVSLHVHIHVHSNSSDALEIDKLASWLTLWLSLDERECHSISPSSDILAFLQARPSAAPLSPLREQSCIVVPICRDESLSSSLGQSAVQSVVVLCGDWAVAESGGTVSGALLSAHKAALLIASIAGRCAS